ncbi:hypothetical protein [Magnetofaba australis]|uniref:hypothetical protein n=1 Tax=Magnetofaba australis TaxID=1472297 RepID=UPI00117DEB90|nr:hypothetical protein [Magnetofaba australis]
MELDAAQALWGWARGSSPQRPLPLVRDLKTLSRAHCETGFHAKLNSTVRPTIVINQGAARQSLISFIFHGCGASVPLSALWSALLSSKSRASAALEIKPRLVRQKFFYIIFSAQPLGYRRFCQTIDAPLLNQILCFCFTLWSVALRASAGWQSRMAKAFGHNSPRKTACHGYFQGSATCGNQ